MKKPQSIVFFRKKQHYYKKSFENWIEVTNIVTHTQLHE